MKTEFLQNFKVGDQALPKEIIDAILAENGRDIEAAKKPFADYESVKEQLKTAKISIHASRLGSDPDYIFHPSAGLTRTSLSWHSAPPDSSLLRAPSAHRPIKCSGAWY